MYSSFMSLLSEAGIVFVGNNKRLDLTKIGKSQLVFPLYSQLHNGLLLCKHSAEYNGSEEANYTMQKAELSKNIFKWLNVSV